MTVLFPHPFGPTSTALPSRRRSASLVPRNPQIRSLATRDGPTLISLSVFQVSAAPRVAKWLVPQNINGRLIGSDRGGADAIGSEASTATLAVLKNAKRLDEDSYLELAGAEHRRTRPKPAIPARSKAAQR